MVVPLFISFCVFTLFCFDQTPALVFRRVQACGDWCWSSLPSPPHAEGAWALSQSWDLGSRPFARVGPCQCCVWSCVCKTWRQILESLQIFYCLSRSRGRLSHIFHLKKKTTEISKAVSFLSFSVVLRQPRRWHSYEWDHNTRRKKERHLTNCAVYSLRRCVEEINESQSYT